MPDFLVRCDDLRRCRIAESPAPDVVGGQALLRVDTFGLTANNVTYAVFGEAMSYWDFFPATDGWGRVPMWGFAEVERSEAEGVAPGTRVYGYLPPSSYLVVTPAGVDDSGFVDGASHRAALPSAYQRYADVAADPFYTEATEGVQMILRPLFFTSFLIDDQLNDDGFVDRGPIVLSSASSKTSIGVAFLLAQRDEAFIVGLTSPRNADFVENLGIYSRVVTYDDIESLERAPAIFVDVAGDAGVRLSVHEHYADELGYSMAVGVTHWEEFGAGGTPELPGPAPVFFFAPDRVTKRSKDWGRGGLNQRVADAWHPFADWTSRWLDLERGDGFDSVERAYREVLEGRVPPERAHVLSI
jgi:hypothetical protein